jgi:hypothetical protein
MIGEREVIPTNAVWFHPEDAKELLDEWLLNYSGVRFAQDFMDKSHGDWRVKNNA